jgi:hypothetical protein
MTTFKASRKEPLAEMIERVHAAIVAAGQGEPSIVFSFSDAPLPAMHGAWIACSSGMRRSSAPSVQPPGAMTPGNLTVEISLDVGTWSRSLTASFKVQRLGFGAVLPLPASRRVAGIRQYPVGDAELWQLIVDNLAALVAEFDRSFVPAVEAAGPTPEWYRPES